MTWAGSAGSTGVMPRKMTRTEWRPIVLDMAIERSSMEITLRNGRRQTRPILRVLFRTESGKEFSGPRISGALRRALENGATVGPWFKARRA